MSVLNRVPVREQDPKVRATNFDEVCLGYNMEEAMEEASRCINCKNAKCIQGCPVSINIPAFVKAVKEGKASLVIISSEASGNTRKKFTNMCSYYKVPLYIYATKEELGHFTGKKFRASVAVLGHEFYDSFVKLFTDMEVTE